MEMRVRIKIRGSCVVGALGSRAGCKTSMLYQAIFINTCSSLL